ncbi:MAG: MlaD family protein, partial [bacterium]
MNRPDPSPREAPGSPSDQDIEEAVPRGSGGKELRVGIFVFIGLVSFFAVLYLTTDPALFRGRYIVTTTVDHAGGVRQGDPVQMRGVNIGRVHRFALADGGVEIALEIEGEWDIPEDSRTRITGTGILGGRTIEVVRGDSPEMLLAGGTIPGSSTGDITDEAQELSAEARSTLERVQALLSEPTVGALEGSAQELDSLLMQLHAFTREQRAQVDRLTESLNRSAQGLEEVAAAGPDAASAVARADSALAQLNETGETLDRAAMSLDNVLARLDRGEGTLGRLARDDSLYVNLN